MISNIMETYIKHTKNFIKEFNKCFFAEKYDDNISDEYISTYIDARIYNFGEEKQRFFYRRIYESIIEKKKEIQKKYETEKKKIDPYLLDDMAKAYQFIFYFDGVRKTDDLKEFINEICEKRVNIFELSKIRGLENKIYKMVKKYQTENEEFLNSFNTEDFILNIEKYTLIDDTYKVKLDYNFKVSYIYSNKVIQEVFNEGTIREDKLMIEYSLLTALCIKDINNGIFNKRYLVEFAPSLMKKEKKLKQTLRIIDNLAIQDKIILKIEYENFDTNRDLIYALMQEGYRFAVIIDDAFSPSMTNIKKLEMFEYLLVSDKNKNYEKIQQNENKIKNTIIYDI